MGAGWSKDTDFSSAQGSLNSVTPGALNPNSMLGKGGSSPSMSAEETEILRQQALALKAQQLVTASQFHYSIEDDGQWRKMSDSEWYSKAGETERKQWDTYQQQLKKYGQAMEGEMPLSRGMQAQKDEEFQGLKATGNVTGNNFEDSKATDTLGAQRINLAQKRWAEIKDQENLNAIGMAGNQIVQGQAMTGMGTQNAQQIGNSQGFSSLMQPYSEYNRAKYQYQANQRSQRMGMIGTGAGLLASMYGGPMAGKAVGLGMNAYANNYANNNAYP